MTNQSTLVDYLDGYADEARRLTGGSSQLSLAGIQSALASVTPADYTEFDGVIDGTATSITNNRVTSIRSYVFEELTTLTSANFESVTTIDQGAFVDCTGLDSINLPSLATLGSNAFTRCSAVKCMILYSPTRTGVPTAESRWAIPTSLQNNQTGNDAWIYINDNLVDTLKVATNWTYASDHIRGISQCPQTYLDLYGIVLP